MSVYMCVIYVSVNMFWQFQCGVHFVARAPSYSPAFLLLIFLSFLSFLSILFFLIFIKE
ncbi:hypothetical protein J3Q64DRAFT_1777479 [Phycomyces blakesleeanus]|uniref:Uncharacterized protein n=1 Tax=Phycomyces blakesleeanus TaxID=4837 RepID=A0ABR3AHB7_PHYBL